MAGRAVITVENIKFIIKEIRVIASSNDKQRGPLTKQNTKTQYLPPEPDENPSFECLIFRQGRN